LPSYSVIAADTLRDLVTLTFDLLALVSGHTWRVTWSTPPPSLKILRLSVLESWVLTSPVGYHWQCVCSHCACAVSRDLCVGGEFFPHISNPWPRFAYSLYKFYGATMTFKGRLLLAPPMLKLFFGWKFLNTKSGLKMAVFWEKGSVNVKFCFCDPKKAHPCQEPRLLTYFASKFVGASWLYVISWTQKNSRVNNLVREVAHAWKQNPLSDLD